MDDFLSTLCDRVDDADSADDLVSIITHVIPLQSIKNLVKNELAAIPANRISEIYKKSISLDITRVMPDALQQSILSFVDDQVSLKYVCKSFQNALRRHEDSWMRSWMYTIEKERFKATGTVYLVDPHERSLTKQQIDDGIKGPIKSLAEALEIVCSGDKVLLPHSLYYELPNFITIDKDIEIEALRDCCCVGFARGLSIHDSKVSLINFRYLSGETVTIENGSLWMTGCNVYLDFDLSDDANVYVTDCKIEAGHNEELWFPKGNGISITLSNCRCQNEGGMLGGPEMQVILEGQEHVEKRLPISLSVVGCTFQWSKDCVAAVAIKDFDLYKLSRLDSNYNSTGNPLLKFNKHSI